MGGVCPALPNRNPDNVSWRIEIEIFLVSSRELLADEGMAGKCSGSVLIIWGRESWIALWPVEPGEPQRKNIQNALVVPPVNQLFPFKLSSSRLGGKPEKGMKLMMVVVEETQVDAWFSLKSVLAKFDCHGAT